MTVRGRVRAAAPAAFVAILAFAVGASGFSTRTMVELGGVLAVGFILLTRPAFVGVLALLSMFNVYRLGAGSSPGAEGGISYSDVALAGASLIALPGVLGSAVIKRLWLPLLGFALYLTFLLPTLILNHSHRSDMEIAHRVVLVVGALIVGAWLAIDGLGPTALRMILGVGFVIGVATIVTGAAHGFSLPAAPLGLNKNYGGALQGALATVTVVLGRDLRIPALLRSTMIVVFTGATIATHSRGSILAICVALLLAVVLGGRAQSRGTRVVVVLLSAALGYYMYTSVSAQMNVAPQEYRLGSLGIRDAVEHAVRQIWRTSPWDGVGLKYFNSGSYGTLGDQPANNVVDNELAESGIIGLVGFVLLAGCVAAAGYRRRTEPVVLTGLALVMAHLAHGQVDVYWQAGLVPLPYIVLGMGLAMPPPDERDPGAPAPSDLHAYEVSR